MGDGMGLIDHEHRNRASPDDCIQEVASFAPGLQCPLFLGDIAQSLDGADDLPVVVTERRRREGQPLATAGKVREVLRLPGIGDDR
jgi:hypothetical protein